MRIAQITIDCEDARPLARFWADALGVPVDPDVREAGAFFQSVGMTAPDWKGPVLIFLKVPETKQGKNRIHLDLHTDDPATEVQRLLSIGASHVHDKAEWGSEWTTLADPEGNVFCVASDD